jgi:hypothetical protein
MVTFRLKDLLALVAVIAIVLGVVRLGYVEIEREFWRVHASEQEIAQHVVELGGAYNTDKANERHITGVWLANTPATDDDVQIVMRLEYLEAVDISNTAVTDASLAAIASHRTLREIRIHGSKITNKALHAVLSSSDSRLFLAE